MPIPKCSSRTDTTGPLKDADDANAFPHAKNFNTKFIFSGEPEQKDEEQEEKTDSCLKLDKSRWQNDNRPAWELHSEKGPNLQAEGFKKNREILQEVVNPIDHDYEACSVPLTCEIWDRHWERLDESSSLYEDKTLSKESLGDDYQLLFVNILLEHVKTLLLLFKANLMDAAKPLRIMLLGTAGTGKTRTVQTTLQEIRELLSQHNIPADFVRCAAPTGCAAWNLKFNATTLHRLIRWTNLRYFDDFKDDQRLADFQAFLSSTCLIFLDEISMIGRRMIGRADARFRQGKATELSQSQCLGNLSCVGIGDPAQCDAMADEQFYDERPRQDTSTNADCKSTRLSNIGLSVYAEFDEVIILTHVHRMSHIDNPQNDEDIAYNERGKTYWDIVHRLREYALTMEDYFWLCRRKHAKLSLSERTFFNDAPTLMDFRRLTDSNPEDNCEFHNKQRLRAFAK